MILLDIISPGLDGFELCRRLRARATTARLPIMVLSDPPTDHQIREAIALKVSGYLTKPVTRETLLGRLQNLIQHVAIS